ncbi:unnamed protein product [Rhodiola kirilowii]
MSPQQDMLKMQTCVLKVNIHCQGCKKKVQKLLNKVEGVYGTEVDVEKGRVTVSGVADPMTLINKLAKSGKPAELLEQAKGQQKVRVIEPAGDTNKVPKGIKKVKVMMDEDELKASNDFSLIDTKDEVGKQETEFGLGNGTYSAPKGKGSGGWAGKLGKNGSGKKGRHIESGKRMGNEWSGKANNGVGVGGGLDGANHGQGAVATKTGQMGQMAHMPLAQIPTTTGGYYQANLPYDHQQQNHMAAVMMNHPQHPMGSNDMYHHPMGGYWSRSDSSGRPPLPPPAADPVAHIFSDENANGCSIM